MSTYVYRVTLEIEVDEDNPDAPTTNINTLANYTARQIEGWIVDTVARVESASLSQIRHRGARVRNASPRVRRTP